MSGQRRRTVIDIERRAPDVVRPDWRARAGYRDRCCGAMG